MNSKKLAFVAAAIVGLLVVAGIGIAVVYYLSENRATNKVFSEIQENDKKMLKEDEARYNQPIEQTCKLHAPFDLGNFQYNVDKVRFFNKFGTFTPQPGARLVVVLYTIKNLSKQTTTPTEHNLLIVDSQGRRFSPSSSYDIWLRINDKRHCLAEMQPGLPREVIAGYEVPPDAIAKRFYVVVEDESMGAKEVAKISLVPKEHVSK